MPKSAIPFVVGGAALGGDECARPAAASRGFDRMRPGKPSVVVHVAGFKQPQGKLKVSLYGSTPAAGWPRAAISKVKVPVTAGRWTSACRCPPGRYAVAVHHDLNTNGERDRQDGGGYSRNPKVSLFNPKPAFAKAAFTVGNGPARVGVTLLYIRGLSVGP